MVYKLGLSRRAVDKINDTENNCINQSIATLQIKQFSLAAPPDYNFIEIR